MKRTIPTHAALTMLILLPGCGRLIDWGKENFYQGEPIDNHREAVTSYIRSVTIYDQFTTSAIFDVLWLSDEVRLAYVDLHVSRQSKNEERQRAMVRRQLEENNHYLSFYILSLHDVKLVGPESEWSLYLNINGRSYQPQEIKEIELPYEYQIFFGNQWNRFKVPYLVRFNANDEEDMPLITLKTEEFALHVRSAHKEHAFVWKRRTDTPEMRAKQKPVRVLHKKRRGKRT